MIDDSTHITFAGLGVSPDLVDALAAAGIDEPFPIQALTIPDAMLGRDVCGKAKTGSGKTLAFGIPMLERLSPAGPNAPRGLVLVPTRELATQVCEVLQPLGKVRNVRVEAVYGGVAMDPQVDALRAGTELVVGTPGRLIDLMDRGELRLDELQVMVLDEADRMLDMGFMPQVQKILYRAQGEYQTMLFSATLDGAINWLVRRLRDPARHEIVSRDVTVDEMEHRFLLVHEMDKVKVAAAITRGVERTLMFCRTKIGADRLARDLEREGVQCAAIHGDRRQNVREKALSDFAAGKLPVLVATDVAARGLDVEGVDVVVHYDPPDDHKSYLHRSGRTARAGKSGVAVTLLLWNEENLVRLLQRRIGVQDPIVEVFSNDPRLADLTDWDPVDA
ncbi:MAG TPA: DEAD/DEAH box helicase [Acidimicrobiia bacterium]|nr:DEAD/DEAH box helicase [Acidimicrobiia bacterium]